MRLWAIVSLCLVALGASADSAYTQAVNEAWGAFSKRDAMEGGLEYRAAQELSGNKPGENDGKHFRDIAGRIQQLTREHAEKRHGVQMSGADAVEKMLSPGTFYVFASFSMPEAQLVDLIRFLSTSDLRVEVVFQGISNEDRSFRDFFRRIKGLIDESGRIPKAHIGLNPSLFSEFSVTHVPHVVYINDHRERASASGLTNLDYLELEFSQSMDDLGLLGPVFEVEEENLIVQMQKRFARIDWTRMKDRALSRYWKNTTAFPLSQSEGCKIYDVDMSVTVTDDIKAKDGTVIAHAGSQFNPLEHPDMAIFDRRIIVFNPNRPEELEWAAGMVKSTLQQNMRPVVMFTEYLKTDARNTMKILEETLRVRAFELVASVVNRFDLTESPTTVERSKRSNGAMMVRNWKCDAVCECEEWK